MPLDTTTGTFQKDVIALGTKSWYLSQESEGVYRFKINLVRTLQAVGYHHVGPPSFEESLGTKLLQFEGHHEWLLLSRNCAANIQ